MNYLLDTNVWVHCLRKKGNTLVKQRVISRPYTEIRHCPIVVGELYYGAESSADPRNQCLAVEAFIRPYSTLPYGYSEAREYARVRADLERRGLPIGPYDMMIAAIALTHNVTLVTHNVREFSRVPGLLIEDWQTP